MYNIDVFYFVCVCVGGWIGGWVGDLGIIAVTSFSKHERSELPPSLMEL